MTVLDRIYLYSEELYRRSLGKLEAGHIYKANTTACAALGAAIFVEQEKEAPEELRVRANRLAVTLEDFLSVLWKEQVQNYGERYLSGAKKRKPDLVEKEVSQFADDLRRAAREVGV